MITLHKEEVFEILKEIIIKENAHKNVDDFKLSVDWKHLSYDRTNNVLFMDSLNYGAPLISFHNGYHSQRITLLEVKDLLKKKFLDSDYIYIYFNIKNLDALQDVASQNEAMELAEFKIEIGYNERTTLKPFHIDLMIDLALKIKDKEWFEELMKKKKDLKESS